MLIRLIIFVMLCYFFTWLLKRVLHKTRLGRAGSPRAGGFGGGTGRVDEMVQDPVCGVYLPKREAVTRRGPHGETYYFCSRECREKFDRNSASAAPPP